MNILVEFRAPGKVVENSGLAPLQYVFQEGVYMRAFREPDPCHIKVATDPMCRLPAVASLLYTRIIMSSRSDAS